MDKLSIISMAFFFAADLLAVASITMPNWIVSEIGGATSIGLLKTCLTIYERPTVCYNPEPARAEWFITFICIVLGIGSISSTILLLWFSFWHYRAIRFARWLGFVAMILFCMAAVIFPIGFNMDQIGGLPYQLPHNFQVGISYIFFVLALWITVVSELFVGKVCVPHL
ncbi:Hypothetical predicted protein [Octopus vulgaris]|uniref:Uncharacterized protein n=2 Tax=Octopus TaxID=6643 RepID=A0AA36AM01_OCTVU|nr:modulator of smoothened protein [Octopus sinensis]CAI9718464.1 Hypothetical predicted protein [Octopus vulgaris]